MEVTEIRIKLMGDSDDRLQAFCSITFDDCFVVRDLKIIEGSNGPFVAMPSRKLTTHCRSCRYKNHLRAQFCNQCGKRISSHDVGQEDDGRSKLYADIAHPINTGCREMIQQLVIDEYQRDVDMSDPTVLGARGVCDTDGASQSNGGQERRMRWRTSARTCVPRS